MNKIKKLNSLAAILLLTAFMSCERNRYIIPNDSDTAEIFAPVTPNEDENPEEPTFGSEHIPGFTLNRRFETGNDEIYVDFNLTLLEVNPEITYRLFRFIDREMKEAGFISEKAEIDLPELNESENGRERLWLFADSVLNRLQTLFTEQLPEIESYEVPFNIAIDVYPVFLNDDYITYREYAYYFTGGAHGNSVSLLETFDLTGGRLLGLNDIVKHDCLQEIRELVAEHMAYSYPIYENLKTVDEYIDSLNVWLGNTGPEESKRITLENYPLNDPAITTAGLAFIYERYELAPGVDGSPVVVLPYDELRDCLSITVNAD